MKNNIKSGEFTGLSKDYSKNRPDYSKTIMKSILDLIEKKLSDIDVVDVGAGTGIWSRMVYETGVNSVIAVEPNEDMRKQGIHDSLNTRIKWINGSAENTGLSDNSADLLTMAFSFHWTKFDQSTSEFFRILKPKGRFTALWNPRLIEVNPILIKIEDFLNSLKPNIKRVSSGRSGITETLNEKLWSSPYFTDIVYLEGRHVINMTPERYIGAWRSVNDLRVQLGKRYF